MQACEYWVFSRKNVFLKDFALVDMKDIIITTAVQKRELKVLLACFVAANIINWVSIIVYQTPWYEIFTQVGYMVVTTLVIYCVLAVLRVIWWGAKKLFIKK